MIRRTSSGVALYRIDMIIELIMTLLPEPVDPAINRCGMVSSAATRMRPLISLPSGIVRYECESWNSSDSSICRSAISSRLVFGTSMPTVGLPGMRSIRIDSACRPRQRSSRQVGDPAVLDAGIGLEFEGGHHRAGIDLHHVAQHVELFELRLDAAGRILQFLLVVRIARRAPRFSRSVGGSRKTGSIRVSVRA